MASVKVIFYYFQPELDKARLRLPADDVLDVNTTYEEILRKLILREILRPLDDPGLHYDMKLEVHDTTYHSPHLRRWNSAYFQEGQTIARALAITTLWDFTAIGYITCDIALRKRPQPQKKPASPLSDTGGILPALATAGMTILTVTASIAAIIQTLIVVQERWEKTHQARVTTGTSQRFPQPGKTDIYAIRLRMTGGKDIAMPGWLEQPDELKRFIDVFHRGSSQTKPTEVVFVLWNRDVVLVNVREGAQGNLQLDEMLRHLKIKP